MAGDKNTIAFLPRLDFICAMRNIVKRETKRISGNNNESQIFFIAHNTLCELLNDFGIARSHYTFHNFYCLFLPHIILHPRRIGSKCYLCHRSKKSRHLCGVARQDTTGACLSLSLSRLESVVQPSHIHRHKHLIYTRRKNPSRRSLNHTLFLCRRDKPSPRKASLAFSLSLDI